jgi:hypothetical protein
MQTIGSKTFYCSGGVWADSQYGGDVSYPSGTAMTVIKFGSDEYFKLIKEEPGIVKYLSLGDEIVICYKGKVYKITKQEKKEEKK